MGVSIIIPVYNIKQEYIEKCISSIYAQSYSDWEVIIVDDGSNENCANNIDIYKNERISIHHQKNSGVSAARNLGIEFATKEWIFFMDPDDWMGDKELERIVSIAEVKNADMVSANAYFYKDGVVEAGKDRYKDIILFEGNECCNEYLPEIISPGRYLSKYKKSLGGFVRTPWAKLYKKQIIADNNVKFPVGVHPSEDTYFNLMYSFYCNRIVLINEKLHYYRISDSGVTSTYKATWISNNENIKKIIRELLKEQNCYIQFKSEWENFCILLLKDIFRLQLFNMNNPDDLSERKMVANKLINEDEDYMYAIKNSTNELYTFRSKIFALLVKKKAYYVLNLLYGRR